MRKAVRKKAAPRRAKKRLDKKRFGEVLKTVFKPPRKRKLTRSRTFRLGEGDTQQPLILPTPRPRKSKRLQAFDQWIADQLKASAARREAGELRKNKWPKFAENAAEDEALRLRDELSQLKGTLGQLQEQLRNNDVRKEAHRLEVQLRELRVKLTGWLTKDQLEAAAMCGIEPHLYALNCVEIWAESIFKRSYGSFDINKVARDQKPRGELPPFESVAQPPLPELRPLRGIKELYPPYTEWKKGD